MYSSIENLPERPAFDWLDLFVLPVCKRIRQGREDYIDERIERTLHEALFVRLFLISQTPLFTESMRLVSSRNTSAEINIGLVPSSTRKACAEEVREKLLTEGETALDSKYPLLRGRLELASANFEAAVNEMFDRIMLHRDEISNELLEGGRFEHITDLNFGGADTHNSGRSTCRVTTDKGIFMYKPHDVRQDAFVRKLAAKFYKNRIRVPASLDYEGSVNGARYGFCEFIINSPATDEESAAEYYRNLGSFAAITQVLGSNDMHFENILSDGVYPIPVDMETCFMPKFREKYQMNPLGTSIINDLDHSVIRSGMFPARINGEFETSPMIAMEDANVSIPVIDGKKRNVYDFLDEFYNGFIEVYRNSMRSREEIRKMFDEAPDFEVRVVLRPTNYYTKLQMTISDPKHLNSSDAVGEMMESRLRFNPYKLDETKWRHVIDAEKCAIMNEDIPYFYTTFKTHDVYDNAGLVSEGVYGRSSQKVANERLDRLSERELEFELCLMKNLIERAQVPVKHDFPDSSHAEIWGADQTASVSVANRIMRDSIRFPNGGIGWFGTIPKTGRSKLTMSYYRGSLGVALALEMFRKFNPDTEHGDLIAEYSDICINDLEDYISYLDMRDELTYPEFNVNLENGCAGWIESTMRLYHITEDKKFLETAKKAFRLIKKYHIPDVKDVSRRNGEAGVLEILCKYSDELEVEESLIRKYGDHLLGAKDKDVKGQTLWHPIGKCRGVSGMDCGMAGIGRAMHIAGTLLGENKYLEAARDAFDYERKIYDESKGGWSDMFKSTVSPEKYGGFSSGNAGLGFLWIHLDEEEMLEKAITSVLSGEPVVTDRLRDGNLGSVDFLIEAGEKLGRPELRTRAREMLAEITSHVPRYTDKQYHQVYEPTLFSGDAGLLYVLMRLENPQEIECILM